MKKLENTATVKLPPLTILISEKNTVNACSFKTRDGKACILLYRGLLDKLGSDDALAAVLGHEIGHLVLDHLYVDIDWMVQKMKTLPMFYYSCCQEMEHEADVFGAELAGRAGYDPRSILPVLDVLEKANPLPEGIVASLGTHPLRESRQNLIKWYCDFRGYGKPAEATGK